VILIDRILPSGFTVGETVSPMIQPTLEKLDAADVLERGHNRADGVASSWGFASLGYRDFFTDAQGPGWHLDRAQFDLQLSNLAKDRGAEVLHGMRVASAKRSKNHWDLRILRSSGSPEHDQIKARFVIDATGRRAAFARRQNARHVRIDCQIGIARIYEGKSKFTHGYAMIEAVSIGWWYCASIPGARTIVILMTDGDLARRGAFLSVPVWCDLLAQTNHIQNLISTTRPSSSTFGVNAASGFLDKVAGAGWVAAGDSAATFDPLTSSGIVNALRSGISSAQVAVDYLSGQIGQSYPIHSRREYEDYLNGRRMYYSTEGRWKDTTYWKRRNSPILIDPEAYITTERSCKAHNRMRNKLLPREEIDQIITECKGGTQLSSVVANAVRRLDPLGVTPRRIIEVIQRLVETKVLKIIDAC
jgi:flavin-dependent dehydrogenase